MFITFEGPEGAGKSTQVQLLAKALRAEGHAVLVTHEPGGTPVGEAIRKLLLAPDETGGPGPAAEALLFAAARAQLVDAVIRPALAQGQIVLCDRFSDSTLAYQVGGRGLPGDAVARLIAFATGGVKPDLTFLLDLAAAIGLARKRSAPVDRLEQEQLAFHERVRSAYLALARQEPGRIVVLDAERPARELAASIREHVRARNSAVVHRKGVMPR